MRLSAKSSFVIALVLLGVCALSLEAATRFMRLHFRKERVELAYPLETIPANLGPWTLVTVDRAISEDEEHILGTSQYLMRVYVDTRVVKPQVIASLKDQPDEERNAVISGLQRQFPEAVVALMVTYYTGMADTVSHVPDRCYIADGYDVADADNLVWPAGGRDLKVRYLTFEDESGAGRLRKNVAYLFSVNGQYVADPIDVRRIMGNLFSRYGYYAKVELMTQQLDRDKSAKAMDEFLASAMPAIQNTLPDWDQYQSKK